MHPPILHGDQAAILSCSAVASGRAVPMFIVDCFGPSDPIATATIAGRWWAEHPGVKRCASFNSMMVEGADVGRADGQGCTREELDAGIAAGVLKHSRDARKMKAVCDLWKSMGVMADLWHVDCEADKPAGLTQAAWDRLRLATFNAILGEGGARVSEAVVEFTAFGDPKAFAVNGDGVRVPVLGGISTRFKSSCQFYSRRSDGTNNPLPGVKLGAWLGGLRGSGAGAYPLVDVCDTDLRPNKSNVDFTSCWMDACQACGATAMVFINRGFGVSVENQCAWLDAALVMRGA